MNKLANKFHILYLPLLAAFLRQSTQAVWYLNENLASVGMVVSGCTALKGVSCKFPITLASLKACEAHNLA